MKRDFFLRAIGEIDEDLIIEANVENRRNKAIVKNKGRFVPYRIAGTAAACLVLLTGVWIAARGGFMKMTTDNAAPEAEFVADMSPAEDAVGSIMDGGGDKDVLYSEPENAAPLLKAEDADLAGSTAGEGDAAAAVNEILREAESAVRCLSVTVEAVDDERVAVVALTEDPGGTILQAVVSLVRDTAGARRVQIVLAEGTEITPEALP